jgi:PIN domain nuclease of toxin-antitoxin system
VTRWLLDTHVLIWALADPERLDPATRNVVRDPTQEVLFSAASIWEIAIKAGRGRVDFALDADEIALEARRVGFDELPVRARAAARVASLAPYHRDPFDRLLIAQAIDSTARLLTADRQLPGYSDLVTLIRPQPRPE